MDYLSLYKTIVHQAKTRILTDYTESHHVCPKSIFATNYANGILNIYNVVDMNDADNIVELTPREHYIVHLLLVKIMKDNTNCYIKMVYASNIMCNRVPNSKEYKFVKDAYIKILKDRLTGKVGVRKGIPWSESVRLKMMSNHHLKGKSYETIYGIEKSNELKAIRSKAWNGRVVSDETRAKLSSKVFSAEHRKKISDHRKNTKMSDETKAKISAFFSDPTKNPCVDKTLYWFQHTNGDKIQATKYYMKHTYACNTIHNVVRGKSTSKGWSLIDHQLNEQL